MKRIWILPLLLLLCAQAPEHILPDRKLTPGDADPALTKEVICNKSWSTHEVRNVPESEKKQVYERYGLQGDNTGYCAGPGGCEIDHLISLELGGKNTVRTSGRSVISACRGMRMSRTRSRIICISWSVTARPI